MGELGQSLIPEKMSSWVLGDYEWNDENDNDTPYLGCNVDRMGHTPKGVMAIRMDGVEDVNIDGLEIYNLQESSPLGSELCGNYSTFVKLFKGGGNVFQNTPYYSGYTGNRVHGIFSDWSIYTLSGSISFHDFRCDTGLARGLGAYTHTEMTWDDDAKFTAYNFASGSELGAVDTDSLDNPFNAAQSEPVHIVWQYNQSTYDKTFYTTMTGRPQSVEYSCILGRDGIVEDDSFGEYRSDNTDCDDFVSSTTLTMDQAVEAKRGRVAVGHHSSNRFASLRLIVWSMAAVALLFAMWMVYRSMSFSKKKVASNTESDPLLQSQK